MCYDDNARPPLPPGHSGAAHGEDIVLTAADGTQFSAYAARPENQAATAHVLILPDVRGLHQFYKELALRFAEIGIAAVGIDYFGRTAGLTARDDSFEYMSHVQELQLSGVYADVAAALAHLKGMNPSLPTFVVGFCMGGSFSLAVATQDYDVDGVIPFYAGLSRTLRGGTASVLDIAENVGVPVLGLFGGADQGIPVSDVEKLDQKLDVADVKHEIVIYPDAPHSFFDRRATDFAEASADAWKRVLEFISARTPMASL